MDLHNANANAEAMAKETNTNTNANANGNAYGQQQKRKRKTEKALFYCQFDKFAVTQTSICIINFWGRVVSCERDAKAG